MKKTKKVRVKPLMGTILVLFFFMCASAYGVDKVEVPLSNPGKPALVKARVLMGSIRVKGYGGKTVLVEAEVVEKPKKKSEEEKVLEKFELEIEKVDERAKGMKLIRAGATGLYVEEENNVVEIRTRTIGDIVDVTIQVPYASSLNLQCNSEGDIRVEKVSGELEIRNLSGPVFLKDVGGTVVAHSMSGELTATFDKVDLSKPMSLSTLSGPLDVTFPKNLKANVKLHSRHGKVYSDFDIKMMQKPAKKESEKTKDGKFRVRFDSSIYGSINGGGQEISLKTLSGNIYLRAKK